MKKPQKPKPKKKEVPARLERRVRVTFFLPAGTKEDQDAVRKVVGSLASQFLVDPITQLTITGFTHSGIPSETKMPDEVALAHALRLEGEIFFGHWWSYVKVRGVPRMSKRETIESVVLFLIDYPSLAEEWELDQVLQRLKEEVFSIYAEHGRPQEEIWMVKEDIHRYA